jgi:hypothetical protein
MLVEEVVVELIEVLRLEGWIVKDVGSVTELKEEKRLNTIIQLGSKMGSPK